MNIHINFKREYQKIFEREYQEAKGLNIHETKGLNIKFKGDNFNSTSEFM